MDGQPREHVPPHAVFEGKVRKENAVEDNIAPCNGSDGPAALGIHFINPESGAIVKSVQTQQDGFCLKQASLRGKHRVDHLRPRQARESSRITCGKC